LNEPDSRIVFLEERERVFIHIATLCPFEISFNGATGFRYDAIKDFIRWHTDESEDIDDIYKEYLPTFLQIGTFLVNELKSNRN